VEVPRGNIHGLSPSVPALDLGEERVGKPAEVGLGQLDLVADP
jgi:hypothetical protein